MFDSSKFIKVIETERSIYYTNKYFDSEYQIINKKTNMMFELYSFGDERMLIMSSGVSYEDACNYDKYLENHDYDSPEEEMVEWFRSSWDINDSYETLCIDNAIEKWLGGK